MAARSRLANSEISIQGDELENDRIQLEHDLQQTDISLHLSSAHEDNDYSDVEYGRHNSGPAFHGFASFDHHSRDHFDPADDQSHYNAWSYRTMDEDESISPYNGRTMSTAAHHASALTLSAGLGGRGSRRDVSLSGAEYDPDRPLQGIIAGFGNRMSGLDADSKQFISAVDFDPLIVDDSIEIERVLSTSRPYAPVPGLHSSGSSTSSSRPATPLSPRPKLSDTLHHVAFSPKRPRNGLSHAAMRTAISQSKSRAAPNRPAPPAPRRSSGITKASVVAVVDEDEVPTPKSLSKNNSYSRVYQQSLSYVVPAEPEVNVFPPTPTNSDQQPPSKFTRMARGLAKEIQLERNRLPAEEERPPFAQSTLREKKNHARTDSNKIPLRSVLAELQDPPAQARMVPSKVRTPMKTKVYLPDITGLTNVVASPAKFDQDYLGYDLKDDELDVRLATALNVIQSKLAYLESEHSVSRRRVRELELELEECKHQVTKERTRVLEKERTAEQQHVGLNAQKRKSASQNKHARVVEEDEDGEISRYKEVVEEKKALENLVSKLRSHLSRLTTELSDHSKFLLELRTLRDSDVRALKDKSHDIDELRREVERLGGEVEVLRGVVEEGLKERREIRERSREADTSNEFHQRGPLVESDDEANDSEVESASGRSTPSPRPSPVRGRRETIHTDQATTDSPRPGTFKQPFIMPEEFDRIAEEVAERRSERSNSALMEGSSHNSYSQRSLSSSSRHGTSDHSDAESITEIVPPTKTTGRLSPPIQGRRPGRAETKQSKLPIHSTKARPPSRNGGEAPFPQIRGEYLERLFFSAPEHNTNTCTVCHRRQRAKGGRKAATTYRSRSSSEGRAQYHDNEDDEGFAEGEDDVRAAGIRRNTKGKERVREAGDDQVPPQTVIARVLRELEDDFTHYKSIYVELADQYKEIDPVSNVAKRNVLAEHLREVIDILEQKGDQIASLYDLLTYNDKPVQESVVPEKHTCTVSAWSTAPQVGSTWSRVQTRRR
ncbi:hypothetical protein BDY19DRAFT_960654 [Irpex rosettiformis]|uniref:Uncharacterized protein n=1 Tax=Irpex rosettiformis TaxID=378272 RepID=A0ACB8TX91_9APHY|nr:hypothetical protein BDY19DRAFT_960654 [Irpex rosettiformis]